MHKFACPVETVKTTYPENPSLFGFNLKFCQVEGEAREVMQNFMKLYNNIDARLIVVCLHSIIDVVIAISTEFFCFTF